MPPIDNTTSGGLDDFRAMLLASETESEKSDAWARQQAAVPGFGRRTGARPAIQVLMQDAAALVVEVLQANLSGVGELVAAESTIEFVLLPADTFVPGQGPAELRLGSQRDGID